MKPINIAILGYGRVAPTHREAILALAPHARLAAVCDTRPEALTRALNDLPIPQSPPPTPHSSLDTLLADPSIDLVSVCTPSGLHAQHGIACARAGKHVLVEKPIDVTLPAAEALVHACETAGVHLFPVYQNRLNTTIQLLKQAIDLGRFGKIHAINSTVIWHRDQAYYDSDPWRGTRAMDGGAFMNQGIHFLDAMHHLGGEITSVQSSLATLARSIECEDTGAAILRFKSGAIGTLFVTMLGIHDTEGSLTVIGEHGLVTIGGLALNTIERWEFTTPHPEQDALARDADYHTASVYGNGHKAFYRNALKTLQSGAPPKSAAPELESLNVLLRIYNHSPSF